MSDLRYDAQQYYVSDDPPDQLDYLSQHIHALEKENERLRTQLAAVTAERDEARARIDVLNKYTGVLRTLADKPHMVHKDMVRQMAGDILEAYEEKETT